MLFELPEFDHLPYHSKFLGVLSFVLTDNVDFLVIIFTFSLDRSRSYLPLSIEIYVVLSISIASHILFLSPEQTIRGRFKLLKVSIVLLEYS